MIVFRLCKKKYSGDLSGRGAEKFGGRWNSKGHAVVYTSQSRALAVTELAVHVPLGIIPPDMVMTTIDIPDDVEVYSIESATLPAGWQQFPNIPLTRKIGDEWLVKNRGLVMKVPSAVVQGDFNYLINPHHADFSLVKILNTERFAFDGRLFGANDSKGDSY